MTNPLRIARSVLTRLLVLLVFCQGFTVFASVSPPSSVSALSYGSLVEPGPVANGNQIELNWAAVDDTLYYLVALEIKTMLSGAGSTWTQLSEDLTTVTQYFNNRLIDNNNYRISVKACNTIGCSVKSPLHYFQSTPFVVNGTCGSAHLNTYSTQPTTGLCSSGQASVVTGTASGPWAWTCNGLSGGTSSYCRANTTNGCAIENITPDTPKAAYPTNACASVTRPGDFATYHSFVVNPGESVQFTATGNQKVVFSLIQGPVPYPTMGFFLSAASPRVELIGRDNYAVALNLSGGRYTVVSSIAPSVSNNLVSLDATPFTLSAIKINGSLSSDQDLDGLTLQQELNLELNPIVKDNNIFALPGQLPIDSDRWFVMQQYRDFLAREGESAGVDGWTQTLKNKSLTKAEVMRSFFDSPEFQQTYAPLVRLYLSYFNRFPDYAGLIGWVNASKVGLSLPSISQSFASSPEFLNTYGSIDDTAFITLCYSNVLGRFPDPAGLSYWQNQLASGAKTRGQVMLGFSESAEFQSLSYSEVGASMAYIGALRRSPDPAGYLSWVNYLDAGNSLTSMLHLFYRSAEYYNRFMPLGSTRPD